MMNPAEFANIAAAEDEFWWYRGMRRIIFAFLDRELPGRKFSSVLEAGCGTGHFAQAIQKRYGWPVYPMDLGEDGLRYGSLMGVERMVQADMRALPYAPSSFDAVLSMDVIVHLPKGEERKPLAEFARVLKPGGICVVRVSALDILRSRHSEFAHERQRFTRSRLTKALTAAGFNVIRSTYANSLLMPVALAKFRLIEPLLASKPESGVEPVPSFLDRLLYAPLAVESVLIGAGINLTIGQSLIVLARKRPDATPTRANH